MNLMTDMASCDEYKPIFKIPDTAKIIYACKPANTIEIHITFQTATRLRLLDFLLEYPSIHPILVSCNNTPVAHISCKNGVGCFTLLRDFGPTEEIVITLKFPLDVLLDPKNLPLRRFEISTSGVATPKCNRFYTPLPMENTLSDAQIASAFVNLGQNCELGIIQRQLGRELPDLYRFSAVPLAWILFGLDQKFCKIDLPEKHQLSLDPHRGDGHTYYYAYQTLYRIQFETGIRTDMKPREVMMRESLQRMAYMSSRLLEDLEEGSRILTYSSDRPFSPAEVNAFSHRLTPYGQACALLVHPADEKDPSGRLRWVAPNVLRASIPLLADPTRVASAASLEHWIPLLRAAHTEIAAHQEALSCLPTDFSHQGYLAFNPDIANWHGSAARHYAEFGRFEGRLYL